MNLTRETAERAMTAFAVVAARGNSRHEAEPFCRQFLIACIAQLPPESAMSTDTTTKMDASKENAAEAQRRLMSAAEVAGGRCELSKEDYDFLRTFVTAAHRRLPSAAAIEKDKKRKQKYSKGTKNKQPVPA